MASAGSSPLARGLLVRMVDTESPTRIIPARAGFTPSQGRERLPVRDHPRSRGVYGHHIIRTSKLPGSSPLARGLLLVEQRVQVCDRIIPARAGFTITDWSPCSVVRDHPRSRGVYFRLPPTLLPPTWIIPARAGFTHSHSPPSTPTTDHPRSRGGYVIATFSPRLQLGSSPLARGLPRN